MINRDLRVSRVRRRSPRDLEHGPDRLRVCRSRVRLLWQRLIQYVADELGVLKLKCDFNVFCRDEVLCHTQYSVSTYRWRLHGSPVLGNAAALAADAQCVNRWD